MNGCSPNSGCCASCGPVVGLSGMGEVPRALTAPEVDSLLSRNPSIAARILEWNTLLSTLDWSQVHESDLFTVTFGIPGAIPSNGICFTDSTYGDVIIFPDASGVLHFTINAGCSSAEPVGPTGLPALPNLSMLTTLGILIAGFLVIREVRR